MCTDLGIREESIATINDDAWGILYVREYTTVVRLRRDKFLGE